jgi:hypothetical protein
LGYKVVAFEPSEPLAALMASRVTKGLNARVYRAGYEDMPRLFPARPEEACGTLEMESSFDAGILGFGSYSHLRTEEQRIRTLSLFARYVRGSILVSFHQSATSKVPSKHTWTGRAWRLLQIGPEDQFSVYIGFTHYVSAAELAAVAARSGLTILHMDEDSRDPHAVLAPIDLAITQGHHRAKFIV